MTNTTINTSLLFLCTSLIFLIVSTGDHTALGITNITVSTDKSTYNLQSTIIVTGHVTGASSGQAVTIITENPMSNIISIVQTSTKPSGDYQTQLHTNSPLWSNLGTYTIIAHSNGASTTGSFSLNNPGIPPQIFVEKRYPLERFGLIFVSDISSWSSKSIT